MDRGGLNLPKITNFNGVKCAKFDGNSRLRLQDSTLIGSLKEWTIQVWIYPTTASSDRSYVFSDYPLGTPITAAYAFISIGFKSYLSNSDFKNEMSLDTACPKTIVSSCVNRFFISSK